MVNAPTPELPPTPTPEPEPLPPVPPQPEPPAPPPVAPAPAPLACRSAVLPRVQARLATGEPVVVVAIGSSSIEGIGASSPSRNFPNRLWAKLQAAYPFSEITVHNRGLSGDTTALTVARFNRDVQALNPDLVILQAGTNDEQRGVALESVLNTLGAGFDTLRAHGYDTLFMDMQYYQEPPTPRFSAFLAGMAAAAEAHGVPVLPRHELMRSYVTAGLYTRAQLLWVDFFHMNDTSYELTAQCAADMIIASP